MGLLSKSISGVAYSGIALLALTGGCPYIARKWWRLITNQSKNELISVKHPEVDEAEE